MQRMIAELFVYYLKSRSTNAASSGGIFLSFKES